MSRIRSIHPAIWTDEGFASLTMGSRLLLIGLWTEADDHGVFEWKPVGLKMKIFPADNLMVGPLLDELLKINAVAAFASNGKEYGVIRNFCRFQRPKYPSYRHPFPEEWGKYVGSTESIPVAFPQPSPRTTGIVLQMESESKKESKFKKKERVGAHAPVIAEISENGRYVFEAGVIKLNQKNFDQWTQSFSHLDLKAELIGLQDWAARKENWFCAVANALTKRNREMKVRLTEAAASKKTDSPYIYDKF